MNVGIVIVAAMLFALAIASVLIMLYFRYQNKLSNEQLLQQEQELAYQKQLIQVTVQSQEEERKRIGQELHDNVGTALSRLKLVMESSKTVSKSEEQYSRELTSNQIIESVIKDVRSISHQLSPTILNLLGLEEAILEIADQLFVSGTLKLKLDNRAKEAVSNLDKQIALALYRTIQELVANTIKHAKAQNIGVLFEVDESSFNLTYSDDGIGLPKTSVEANGMGLKNIAGRIISVNGSVKIDTEVSSGFCIHIKIPYYA